MRCLILALEAPIMSWAKPTQDATAAPNRPFPGVSMVTGLMANALGFTRENHRALQIMQDAIIIASRIDREPALPHLDDLQTAELAFNDRAWTTMGRPQGRGGERSKYQHPHPVRRLYLQDTVATVAVSFRENEPRAPDLEDVAQALDRPHRPLYIGRRSCIPSRPVNAGLREAAGPLTAVMNEPLLWHDPRQPQVRMQWTEDQNHAGLPVTPTIITTADDLRDWDSRLMGGHRYVIEGHASTEAFPQVVQEAAAS